MQICNRHGAMPRFRDFTDFPDPDLRPEGPARTLAVGGPRGEPLRLSPRGGANPELARPRPAGRALSTGFQKKSITPGSNKALASAVENLNVTLSSGKMRAQALQGSGPKAHVDQRRSSQAISEAVAKQSAQAATRARSPAKAIAADRRFFNPTSGPKTLYGTPASVAPSARARFRFAFPAVSVPCVARKTRKEVLFATNHVGRSSSRKPKRRGPYSDIGC